MAAKAIPIHQPLESSGLGLAIAEDAPFPMAMMEGPGHIVRYANPAFCRLLDKTSEQLVGLSFSEGLPENDIYVALLDRVYRTAEAESHIEADHSKSHVVLWSFTMWPVLADERPTGVMIQVTETAQQHEKTIAINEALVLGSLRQHELTEAAELMNVEQQKEISDRKHAEERVQLLMGELAHRGQNQLAVLQSIASRSLTGDRSLAEARDVFMHRLYALGRTRRRWSTVVSKAFRWP